jgi:excisionase family DNA binding protein
MEPFKRNLTPFEAAKFLGVSRKFIYKLLDEGALAGFTLRDGVRSPIRIPRESLEYWERERAKKTAESKGFSLQLAPDYPAFLEERKKVG